MNSVLRTVATLAVLAAIAAALLAYTNLATEEKIAGNDRAYRLRLLTELVPPGMYDNDFLADTVSVEDPSLPSELKVYRARLAGTPIAVVMRVTAQDGYSGPITLLVAADREARLLGVRAAEHRETPGLGDAIDADKSDWILGFGGRSLGDPALEDWAVRKDGGVFDQFTGATVTPRAIVNAVRDTLVYFDANRDALFAAPATEKKERETR